ncbi:pentapeptide repeat-containing protein [Nostoc linckia FACHB-104]|nr:pentapeptide repeat-containing protein [Nostoc linckia FACHB-104]
MSQPPENLEPQQLDANLKQADSPTSQNVVLGNQNRVVQGNENQGVLGDSNTVVQGSNSTQNIHITNYYYREDIRLTAVQSAEDAASDEKLSCPYRGLFHFSPDDAEYFFGREVFIEELFTATKTRNFIPVLGASGSGKSSVVLAGLVPKLQQESHWLFTHFRPGSDPFYALAEALVPLYTPDLNATQQIAQARELAEYFHNQKVILSDVITTIQHNHLNHRILLIADQFEELYTLCNDEIIRRRFLDCLLAIIQSSTNKLQSAVVVATMRADFLGNALSYRLFADVLQTDIKLIAPMNRKELKQVVEKPALKLGVTFEPGLIERILDDVDSEPGNLPLLEFALTLLWEKRTNKQLTHAAYEAIGEVQGALASHADTIYKNCNTAKQQQVSRIFMQLVRPGEGTEDTRRVATKAELGEENWSLVQDLADARLVVTSRSTDEQETVEVAHEALIQHWQVLQSWIDENRSKIIQKNKIERLAIEWQENKQLNDYLLQGKQLKQAKAFKKEEFKNFALSDLACEFTKKSIQYERSRALKTGCLLAIPLLITFVSVVPLIRQVSEREAWNTIKDPKNPGVRGAIELLSQGCLAKMTWSEMPDFLVTYLFGNCANFINTNLSGANLSGANLSGANLSRTNLSGANLSSANLSYADLISANLISANLSGTDLSSANLRSANLSGANLRSSYLSGANLSLANLSGANLSGTNLTGTHLSGANFSNANLSNTNLRSTDLGVADLRSANLRSAYLGGARLIDANLRSADLRSAYLGGADLSYNNLNDVNLENAKFSCIEIYQRCTNLTGAKNLKSEQLKAVTNKQQACYDPEFRKKLGLSPENPKECKN